MKKMLKGLSVLEVIIGIAGLALGVMALMGAGVMAPADEAKVVTTFFSVEGVLLVISGLFNLLCGLNGLGGAKGNHVKLKRAITLGWIGLLAAALSVVMTLVGNVNANSIVSAACSAVVPVLFLVSAYGCKK